MKKNIVITAGPTNERIDSVMKITNMSTGALGCVFAETFLENKEAEINKIFYISTKMSYKPKTVSDKIEYITIESTDDLISAVEKIFENNNIDIVIHSSAVGDYKGKYSVRAEDLAREIYDYCNSNPNFSYEELLNIFEHPKSAIDDSCKMSSYEPHLMTMLTLTPKVIGMIKERVPNAKLVGFKLLDSVPKEELLDVAMKLRAKNKANYIVANDLSKIGKGKHRAIIVGENGIICECETKKDIALSIQNLVF
ncbi:MAG: phosphopantothenate--cysteine ligase [Clostridia bacterium]|nr:phosphopantothenate--cysteine ligase [Clostridia bacterium]